MLQDQYTIPKQKYTGCARIMIMTMCVLNLCSLKYVVIYYFELLKITAYMKSGFWLLYKIKKKY